MKFDLTDLRIFLAAVEAGSLTAAAAQNNVVVAAVSARLRRLETAFGLELFERTGRGIRPTLAGEMFIRHARQIVDGARKAEIELDEFALGRSGHVRLLSNTNMLAEHMPRILGSFLAANPHVDVSVHDRPSLEVANMLRNGDADIGIVAASADMTGLECWRFVPDRLVLVVPASVWPANWPPGPRADEALGFSRILNFPLIGLQERVALSQFLLRQAHELGRKPSIRIRVDGFEGLCRLVEAGAGIGIVPETAALRYRQFSDYRIVEIAEGWAERELYLCVRNEGQLPGYAQKLLRHLLSYVTGAASPADGGAPAGQPMRSDA